MIVFYKKQTKIFLFDLFFSLEVYIMQTFL